MRERRRGVCNRCGAVWVLLLCVVWAAGTLCEWVCIPCELATRGQRRAA